MAIKDSEMSSLVQIAERATNNLVLPLNNLSYSPSEAVQRQIISEWREKGLKEKSRGFCEFEGQTFYIGRLLSHMRVEGQFILSLEPKGGLLSVTSVKYGSSFSKYGPQQICDPLVLGCNRHVIDDINNLDTAIGKVTLYTTDEAGSKWSLHCGRRGWGDDPDRNK